MRITTVMAAALSLGSLLSGQVSAEIVGGGTTAALNLYNVASVLPRLLPDDFNYIGVGSGAGKTAFPDQFAGTYIPAVGYSSGFRGQ